MTVRTFYGVARCNFVNVDRRFRDAYCFHYQGDKSVRKSESLVDFYEPTRRRIPQAYHLLSAIICRQFELLGPGNFPFTVLAYNLQLPAFSLRT
jgi:hypothetical protein